MSKKKQSAADLAAENADLRAKLDAVSTGNAAILNRLAQVAPQMRAPSGELMVGIRNISDNTIGLKSPFASEPDVQLHGDTGERTPGNVAAISYAWWQRLRNSSWMEEGLIMRDDSVLGESFLPGPSDRPEDLAPGWGRNAVVDPEQWVAEKSESQLRDALNTMTSEAGLRRVRHVVDKKVKELELSFGDDPKRAEKAVRALPALYTMIDQAITMKLELDENQQTAVNAGR